MLDLATSLQPYELVLIREKLNFVSLYALSAAPNNSLLVRRMSNGHTFLRAYVMPITNPPTLQRRRSRTEHFHKQIHSRSHITQAMIIMQFDFALTNVPEPRLMKKLLENILKSWLKLLKMEDIVPIKSSMLMKQDCHRKRRQFKQTDAFTRGMVIGLKRAGWSIRQIAADTHLGASTVHRLWRRWLEQGNVAIYRNVGATRVTSARVDRRILRQAVAALQATCTAILQHVQDTLDHSISTRTISRRLVANGLHSCRPLRRLPLTPPNRRQRLEWCRARSTWMTEWHRVVFSDESRFCLSSDSRRVRVWRRRGERSNPAAIVERPTVRQRGIMVWGAIAYDSRSPLLRIQGTLTAQRYVDDVLRPVTLPYLQGVPNALYQQDNARPHTARISQQALQDVQMLPWPPYSPDLSPIEHVWDIIGRRLHALPQPRSEDELWQMVEREWRAIPQDAIRTLIDSLPRRVAACIAVRGGPTCY
ncbi:Transposase [Cordylochernes scorpioides]|uniref:Transposase n=1 Tax=Cordylochernes scorpioides TaxID=51811 RepID=A0ABY6KG87_9ARAC|nr:Transposase [Cordylochernes scorpioides]